MILTETSTQWGNMYRHRYYLDGRRIPAAEAEALFETHNPKQISSERPKLGRDYWNWRSKWEITPSPSHP